MDTTRDPNLGPIPNEHEKDDEKECKEDEKGGATAMTKRKGGASATAKPPKPPKVSKVWESFTKEEGEHPGEMMARCLHCGNSYHAQSKKHGTSSLRNHLRTCKENPENKKNQSQTILSIETTQGGESSLLAVTFNKEECRKVVSEYIVLSELPFRHVESVGFRRLIRKFQPKFTPLSRTTIGRDISKLYLDEKHVLKKLLNVERVSITTDT